MPAIARWFYDKGAWGAVMLHNHLGRDRMLAGLGAFCKRYIPSADPRRWLTSSRPCKPIPKILQLTKPRQTMVYDVALPELQISEIKVRPADGRLEITAQVENIGSGEVTVELAVTRRERFLAQK